MTKLCTLRFNEFGTAGNASKIKKVLPVAEMASGMRRASCGRRLRGEALLPSAGEYSFHPIVHSIVGRIQNQPAISG